MLLSAAHPPARPWKGYDRHCYRDWLVGWRRSAYPGMPQNAINAVDVDYAVPVAKMGAVLMRLAEEAYLRGSRRCSSTRVHR